MKKIPRTKIEWCKNPDGSNGYVWNPIWGCLNNYPYCFARKFAWRFGYQKAIKEFVNYDMEDKENQIMDLSARLRFFKPTFLEHNFAKEFPKKPSMIYINSMSDVAFWKSKWMKQVLNKIKEYPQHRFVFLTKEFDIYSKYTFPKNCLLGLTVTNQNEYDKIILNARNLDYFLNFEPLFSNIELDEDIPFIKWLDILFIRWLILGAETGNRKDKIIPKREWIESIIKQAKFYGIKIFLKNNLKEVWGKLLIQEKIE